jgi:hypothetical protein
MHKEKYGMRLDNIGWTIFDTDTQQPAVVNDVRSVGVDIEDAGQIVNLPNRVVREAKEAPKH